MRVTSSRYIHSHLPTNYVTLGGTTDRLLRRTSDEASADAGRRPRPRAAAAGCEPATDGTKTAASYFMTVLITTVVSTIRQSPSSVQDDERRVRALTLEY